MDACFVYVTLRQSCLFVSLDGVPSCANKRLLTDILRGTWNFTGYVVSDDDALENIVNAHHYLPTYVEAAAAAVGAGCNLELTGDKSGWVFSYLPQVHTGVLQVHTQVLNVIRADCWLLLGTDISRAMSFP